MPENTPINLDLGISTQVNLKLENNRLFDNIANVNNNVNSFEYKPLKFTDFMSTITQDTNNAPTKISLEDALISEDPEIQSRAFNLVNQATSQRADLKQLNSGIGTIESTPLTEESKKFADEVYGYTPGINNDAFYNVAEDTGTGVAFRAGRGAARFTGRVLGTAFTKLGTGVGYVLGMVNPTNWDENYWNNVADNGFATLFEGMEAKIKEDYIPVFKPEGYNDYSLFNKLGTAAFWEDSAADVFAFMASAIVPGLGFSKLGAGARFGRAFATLAETAEAAETLGQVGKLANTNRWVANALAKYGDQALTTVYNTASESFFEAKGVRDSVVRDLTEQRDRGEIDMTDDEIKQQAAEAAKNNFWSNSAFLTLSNSIETSWMFKAFNKGKITSSLSALGQTEAAVTDISGNIARNAAGTAFEVAQPTTRLGRILASKAGYYTKKGIQGIATEGFYEENIQLASERQNSENPTGGFWSNMKDTISNRYFQQIGNALSGKDTEAAESIFLGGLLGAGMGGGSSIASREYSKNKANIQNHLDILNEAEHNWRKIGDIYKTETVDGRTRYVRENGKLVEDVDKLNARKEFIDNAMSSLSNKDASNTTENFAKNYAFSTLVQSHINSGTFDLLIDTLEKGRTMSDEELVKNGFDPSSKNVDEINKLTTFAKEIKKVTDQIYNIPLAKDQKENLAQSRKRYLVNQQTLGLINSKEIDSVQADYSSAIAEATNNRPELIDETDSIVSQNNRIQSKINVIENTLKTFEAKENKTKYEEEKIKEFKAAKEAAEKQLKEFKTINEDILKDLKVDEDGILNYKGAFRNLIKGFDFELGALDANADSILADVTKLYPIVSGYDYYEKINSHFVDKAEKIIASQKAQTAIIPVTEVKEVSSKEVLRNIFGDTKENNEGDFVTLTEQALNEVLTGIPQVTELSNSYKKLYTDLVNEYNNKVIELRKKSLQAEQEIFTRKIETISSKIESDKTRIQDLTDEINQAQKDLTLSAKDLKSQAKTKTKLNKIIKESTKLVKELEENIKNDNDLLTSLKEEQNEIVKGIQQDTTIFVRELRNSEILLSDIQRVEDLILSQKEELNDLKRILKNLVSSIKKRFSLIDDVFGKTLAEGEQATEQDLDGLEDDQIQEILRQEELIEQERNKVISLEDKINNLQNSLGLLESELKTLENSSKSIPDSILNLKKQIQSIAKTQVMIALRNRYEPTEMDKIMDSYFSPSLRGSAVPFTQGTEDKRVFETEQDDPIKLLNEYFYTTIDPLYTEGNEETNRHQRFLNRLSTMSIKEFSKKFSPLKKAELITIPITKYNIDALGLNGLVDPQYLTDDVITTGIYTVYASKERVDGKDVITLLDENLNKIKDGQFKKGTKSDRQFNQNVLDNVVFSQIRKRTILNDEKTKAKYLSVNSLEEIKEAENKAISFYTDLLNNTKDIYNNENNKKLHEPWFLINKLSQPFTISRGVANKALDNDGIVKNAFTQTIMSSEDINSDSVFLPTAKTINQKQIVLTVAGDTSASQMLTVGRPYVKTQNFIEQYHYADNNIISAEQVEGIVEVIYQMSKKAKDKLDKGLLVFNENKPLPPTNSEDYRDLFKAYSDDQKSKKENALDLNYVKYLKSILFWKVPEADENIENISDRQIWMRSGKIYGGNSLVLDFTDPESIRRSSELRDWLNKYNHNINNLNEKEREEKYTEFFLNSKGSLEKRIWNNYATYLLSDKNPDGSKRNFIPLTTAIKTPQQVKDQGIYGNEYFPYISKGLILHPQSIEKNQPSGITDNAAALSAKFGVPIVNKTFGPPSNKKADTIATITESKIDPKSGLPIVNKTFGPQKNNTKIVEPKQPFNKSDLPIVNKTFGPPKGNEVVPQVIERIPFTENPTVNSNIIPVNNKYKETITAEPEEINNQEEIKVQEQPIVTPPGLDLNAIMAGIKNKGNNPKASEGNFRIIDATVTDYNKENVDKVVAEVSKMLPQIPIEVLDRVISINATTSAWGQFTGKSILLYKGAEEGTLYHEAFEVVANSVLSDKEMSNLIKEFKNRKGSFIDRESGKNLNYSDATDYQAKEQLAEEFRDYKLEGKVFEGKTQMNLFQRILQFLKDFIFNLPSIQDVFENLDKGFYADKVIIENPRFGDSNYRIASIPEAYYQNFLQAATSRLFKEIFATPESLVAIDEINLDKNKYYNNVKQSITNSYARVSDVLLDVMNKNPNSAEIAQQLGAFITAEKLWSEISESELNWSKFIQDHQMYIRQYGIGFNKTEVSEDAIPTEEDRDNKNMNEYVIDKMSFDNKLNASSSIKLLFASIPKTIFTGINPDGTIAVMDDTRNAFPTFLESLDNYDLLIQEVYNKLGGINDIEIIKEKFLAMIGLQGFEDMSNGEKQDIILSLTEKQASLYRIYSRLFGSLPSISTEAKYKLQVKFNNYVAKQRPIPMTMFLSESGNIYMQTTYANDLIYNIKNAVKANLQKNKSFSVNSKTIREQKEVTDKNGNSKMQTVSRTVPYYVIKGIAKNGIATVVNSLEEARKITDILGLQDYFNDEFYNNLALKSNKKQVSFYKLLNEITTHLESMNRSQSIVSLTVPGLQMDGRVNKLLDWYMEIIDAQQPLSYLGVTNKSQQAYVDNNYLSRVIADINNSSTIDEFYEKNPQYQDTFATNSEIIKKLFDEDGLRTSYKIDLGTISGWKDDMAKEGQTTASLSLTSRTILNLNSNLRGFYNTVINADSETEWFLNMGNVVEFDSDIFENENSASKIDSVFKGYLEDELNLILSKFGTDLVNLNGKSKNKRADGSIRKIHESLRMFDFVLDQKLLDKIYKQIDSHFEEGGKKTSAKKIISANDKAITENIQKHFSKITKNRLEKLIDKKIVKPEGNDTYSFFSLDEDFMNKNLGKQKDEDGSFVMNLAEVENLLAWNSVNFAIANIEIYKLFFGDPGQFKDAEKRIKSMLSPVEWSFYDTTGEYNSFWNEIHNRVENNEEYVQIAENDIFNHKFSNELTSLSTQDIITVDVELYNLAKRLFASNIALADPYAETNEADAQSVIDIQTFKEIMIKSGDRWTNAMETQFQYEMAYARVKLAEKGKYNGYESNLLLKEADEKILAKYTQAPAKAMYNVIKPLYAGSEVSNEFRLHLLKTSMFPLTYRTIEGTDFEDLYLKMLEGIDGRKLNIFTFESSTKVGLKLNDDGEKPTIYEYDGSYKVQNLSAKKHPVSVLSFKHFGIQQETQGYKESTTMGTQLTKHAKANLMADGLPNDFINSLTLENGKYIYNGKEYTKGELLVYFDSLSEEEKGKISPDYKDIREHDMSLTRLKDRLYYEMLTKLGAKEISRVENGKRIYSYDIQDKSNLRNLILDELTRRHIDQNTIDSVSLTKDLTAFKNSMETLPSYNIVRNIIYAIVDSYVVSPKVNGKARIQVASTFFNPTNSRKAIYREGDEWITLNTKEEFDAAQKAKKNIVFSDNGLKSYSYQDGDKQVSAMEVMIPDIYLKKVNASRVFRGMKELNRTELLEWLNKPANRILLEGIGFRIPTQATSSVEFFVIKDFLPETMGSTIVVPSLITTKAGSDFDVDKLNTYMNNWFVNDQGLPEYEKVDSNPENVKKRYDKTYRHYRNGLEVIKNNKYFELKGLTTNEHVNNLLNSILDDDSTMVEDWITPEEATLTNRYERLVMKANEEELIAPTLEEFSNLPIHLQNSSKALQNEYFQNIRKLISKPSNASPLLLPNSNEQIKDKRNLVMSAKDANYSAKDKIVNFGKLIDFDEMTEQRNNFVNGKKDVGVYAIASTNHINSQLVGGLIVIRPEDILEKDQFVMDLNNNSSHLPFKTNTIDINGVEYTSFTAQNDPSGIPIGEKISQYVSGAVDVAKDPILIQMGADSMFAGIYAFMERITDGETTALFMMQPIIREYLQELHINKSLLPFRTSRRKITNNLLERSDKEYDASFMVNKSDMKSIIRKAANKQDLTQNEWDDQVQIFKNFLKLELLAGQLLGNVMASNHDTSSFNNDYAVYLKQDKLEVLKEGTFIKSFKNGKFVPLAEAILDFTFVGADRSNLEKVTNLFDDKTFILKNPKIDEYMHRYVRNLNRSNPYLSADKFGKIMRGIELSAMDYTINTSKYKGDSLNNKSGELLSAESPYNLYNSFQNLKEQIRKDVNHPLRDNYVLNNLDIKPTNEDGIVTFALKYTPKNNDVFTKDRITEAFRILRDNPSSANFYEKIKVASYLRNGLKFTVDGFSNLLPSEDYSSFLKDGLKDIDKLSYEMMKESYIRKEQIKNMETTKVRNFSYFNIVKVTENSIAAQAPGKQFGRSSGKDPNVIWTTSKNQPGKFSLIKHSIPSAPNKVSHVIFVNEYDAQNFGTPKDFIVIPNRKEGYDYEGMIKNRDWSFMEYVLYKRVGMQNNTKVVKVTESKGRVFESIAYKPIATLGSKDLNEVKDLKVETSGEILGDVSILARNPQYMELEDETVIKLAEQMQKSNPDIKIIDLSETKTDTILDTNKFLKLADSSLNNDNIVVPSQDEDLEGADNPNPCK